MVTAVPCSAAHHSGTVYHYQVPRYSRCLLVVVLQCWASLISRAAIRSAVILPHFPHLPSTLSTCPPDVWYLLCVHHLAYLPTTLLYAGDSRYCSVPHLDCTTSSATSLFPLLPPSCRMQSSKPAISDWDFTFWLPGCQTRDHPVSDGGRASGRRVFSQDLPGRGRAARAARAARWDSKWRREGPARACGVDSRRPETTDTARRLMWMWMGGRETQGNASRRQLLLLHHLIPWNNPFGEYTSIHQPFFTQRAGQPTLLH